MLTTGRGNRRAASGSDRVVGAGATGVPDSALAGAVTAGGGSATTTPSIAPTATTAAPAFSQRRGYHESTNGDTEHECAHRCHRVPPPSRPEF